MRTPAYFPTILVLVLLVPTLLAFAAGSDDPPAQPLTESGKLPEAGDQPPVVRINSLLLEELEALREETDLRLASLAEEIASAKGEQRADLSRQAAAVKSEYWAGTMLIRARYAREAGFDEQALELEAAAERMTAGYVKGTPPPRSAPAAPKR